MFNIFLTILPIFLVISVGFILQKFSFISDSVINGNNKLVFNIFLPALLIDKISTSNISQDFDLKILFIMYGGVLLAFIVSVLIALLIKVSKNDIGTFAMDSFRGNFAYMGLPVAYYVFSDKGVALGSILLAFIVPFVNAISVFSLTAFSKSHYRKVIKDSFLNSIVIASLLGVFLSAYNIALPNVVSRFLKILSLPALPLALIGIGASLKFKETIKKPNLMLLSSFIKLIVLPFMGILLLRLFSIESLMAKILIIMLAAPPATLNYILAQQMNGNELLASSTICFSTIFSFITYGFWIYYMQCYF